jgi:hypothetical protein
VTALPTDGPAHGVGVDADENGWVAAMRAGDFDRAWAINDRDLALLCQTSQPKHQGPRHLQRIWRREELRGKRVLVRCYHGLGDTIQFIRFMPSLRRIAREVLVWCQPEVLALIERVDGVDRAMPLHDGTPDVPFDVDIEIMEIPHAIRAGRSEFEMPRPYLRLASRHRSQRRRPDGPLLIGLVWEVGDWDKRRAVPAALLKRLDVGGVQLRSFQRGTAANAATYIGAADFSTPDLETLGQRIGDLDVLVCVDTMVAHLAGALGCETWIMLQADCDWRWPRGGSKTYWYSSARLFHQPGCGDWSTVVEDIRSALQARLAAQNARRPNPFEEIDPHHAEVAERRPSAAP